MKIVIKIEVITYITFGIQKQITKYPSGPFI